ncbi:hypothetical protein, partial [Corynebacterium variabile]|uniref:hypothetical protein n=1 Tax=Corynebacterium variabile TaxID=1727 RepID=UPI001D31111B
MVLVPFLVRGLLDAQEVSGGVADAPQEHECLQVRSSGHLTIAARLLAGLRVLRMDEAHGVED